MKLASDAAQSAVLERFVATCEQDERIVAAFVGGSVARGAADEWSDLDLYVITSDEGYDAFFQERGEFMAALGKPVYLEDFNAFGFDMVLFTMEDGIEGELGLLTEKQVPTLKQSQPTAEMIDLAKGIKPIYALNANKARFCSWSDDGRELRTIGATQAGDKETLQHWDVATGELVTTSLPYCSPDHHLAAIPVSAASIDLVDVRTGQPITTLATLVPPNEVLDINGVRTSHVTYFTPTQTYPAAWSPSFQELTTTTLGYTGSEPSGRQVVSVQRWDVNTGNRLAHVNFDAFPALLEGSAISPDSNLLAASYYQYLPRGSALHITLWDMQTGQTKGTITTSQGSTGSLFWSPDGKTLAVGGEHVTLIDAATGVITHRLPEVVPPTYTPTPNPNPAPVGTEPGSAPLPVNTAQSAPLPVPSVAPPGYTPPITPAALLPDADANEYFYVNNITWSPDGATIATYDVNYIRFWDAATGALKAIARHPYSYCSHSPFMAWSPDGRFFATIDCTDDIRVLRLWDGVTAAPLRELIADVYGFQWSPSPDHLTLLIDRIELSVPEIWSASQK